MSLTIGELREVIKDLPADTPIFVRDSDDYVHEQASEAKYSEEEVTWHGTPYVRKYVLTIF